MSSSAQGLVIGFAGRIGSGKSTLSQQLADELTVSRVGFGDYVRMVATYLGLDSEDRLILQDIGEFLARYPKEFCSRVLEQAVYQPGQSLVIDGIRHKLIVDELRVLVAPARFILVYIAADNNNLEKRLHNRGQTAADLIRFEQHSTEAQVQSLLAEVADIHLIAKEGDMLDELMNALHIWRAC